MTTLTRYADVLITDAHAVGQADDLLTTAELCQWLRRSKQWAEIRRHKGLPPRWVKCGAAVRYFRQDVLAWLAECTTQTTTKP